MGLNEIKVTTPNFRADRNPFQWTHREMPSSEAMSSKVFKEPLSDKLKC